MKKALTLLFALTLSVSVISGCAAHKEANTDALTENDEMNYGYSQYVELAEYKNPTINWESEKNASLLSQKMSSSSVKKVTDRAVKKGDTVNIDYEGFKDNVAFEGGTAQGYDLEIGSGSFIDGFEDGLIGKMPGGTYDLNLTFPENYQSTDLAGQAVVFKVKINYISEPDNSEEAANSVKSEVMAEAIINDLVETSNFKKLPQDRVDYYTDYINNYYLSIVQQQGYDSVDSYISQNAIDKTQFESDTKNSVELQVKTELVLKALAEKEGLNITTDEYNDKLKEYANTYSTTTSEFEEKQGKSTIESVILQEKVFDYLNKNVKLKQ